MVMLLHSKALKNSIIFLITLVSGLSIAIAQDQSQIDPSSIDDLRSSIETAQYILDEGLEDIADKEYQEKLSFSKNVLNHALSISTNMPEELLMRSVLRRTRIYLDITDQGPNSVESYSVALGLSLMALEWSLVLSYSDDKYLDDLRLRDQLGNVKVINRAELGLKYTKAMIDYLQRKPPVDVRLLLLKETLAHLSNDLYADIAKSRDYQVVLYDIGELSKRFGIIDQNSRTLSNGEWLNRMRNRSDDGKLLVAREIESLLRVIVEEGLAIEIANTQRVRDLNYAISQKLRELEEESREASTPDVKKEDFAKINITAMGYQETPSSAGDGSSNSGSTVGLDLRLHVAKFDPRSDDLAEQLMSSGALWGFNANYDPVNDQFRYIGNVQLFIFDLLFQGGKRSDDWETLELGQGVRLSAYMKNHKVSLAYHWMREGGWVEYHGENENLEYYYPIEAHRRVSLAAYNAHGAYSMSCAYGALRYCEASLERQVTGFLSARAEARHVIETGEIPLSLYPSYFRAGVGVSTLELWNLIR